MHLYHLTLQRPGAINAAVFGSFSAPKRNEFAVARGHVLEVLRPDAGGKLHAVHSTEVFGLIRSLLRYRLHGQEFDHLVVGSDSGMVTVVRYSEEKRAFVVVQRETYGKSGCRRIVPGQLLAGDPRGRAFMVAAIEKQKFVYLTNREDDLLTISSPLEAHKSHTVLFDVAGVDAGFDNPQFAALELEYADADADPSGEAAAAAAKMLVLYELDLGLNTIARKWARETDRGANALLTVPGGSAAVAGGAAAAGAVALDGPGGVLVLAENWVIYERAGSSAGSGSSLRAPIPRRADMPDERGLLLTASTLHRQKAGVFFALLQSELGDLYKCTLEWDAATGAVTDVVVQYFDTIPPAASLAVSRNGLLFAAAETGNHLLYQFVALGEASAGTATSRAIRADDDAAAAAGGGEAVEVVCPVFVPQELTNLAKVDELPSLGPLVDLKAVAPPLPAGLDGAAGAAAAALAAAGAGGAAAAPFLAALCGRGPRSTLRLLREGLPVTEAAVSPLPGAPTAVFSIRDEAPAEGEGGGEAAGAAAAPPPPRDRLIIISFADATMALSVGEAVEEVGAKETGLLEGAPTLAAQQLASGALLQVHPGGMRLITGGAGEAKRIQEWRAPGKRAVVRAAANARQVALALAGGDVLYFELDAAGRMAEVARRALGAEVTALALGPVPRGRMRAPHLALADAASMVRVLSLDPAAPPLTQASAQALRAPAESLVIAHVASPAAGAAVAAAASSSGAAVAVAPLSAAAAAAAVSAHLFIGLANGVLTRVLLDGASGGLSDPRTRFLGARPVRLQAVELGGQPAVVALSSRPWLCYSHRGRLQTAPLCYPALAAAAPFASDALPDGGVVAVSGSSLRILCLERLDEAFHAVAALPLRYTPRRMALHPSPAPGGPLLAVLIEADHNALSLAARARAAAGAAAAPAAVAAPAAAAAAAGGGDDDMEMDMETEDDPAGAAGVGSSAAGAAAAANGGVSGGGPAAAAAGADEADVAYSIAAPSLFTPAEAAGAGAGSDPQAEGLDPRRVGAGPPPAAPGCWASAVRLVDLAALLAAGGGGGAEEGCPPPPSPLAAVHHLVELPADEAAVSVAVLPFHAHGDAEAFVVVGTVARMTYHPRAHAGAALRTYRLVAVAGVPVDAAGVEVAPGAPSAAGTRAATTRLQFLHRTPLGEGVPYALCAFQGRLLAGVGAVVRLYDLGKRALLRKAEARGFPTLVAGLAASGDRVFVADAAESVHVLRFRAADASLALVADDAAPRHCSALLGLDHDTVAAGDKFGNVCVLRVPPGAEEDAVENPSGSRLLWEAAGSAAGGVAAVVAGAPSKLQQLAHFYVGAAVMALQKATLAGGAEVLLYATISGAVGALLPFGSREDLDLLTHMELFLRNEGLPLLGRDHTSFRSYYVPVKDVVDGDLCEAFAALPIARQRAVASDLERTAVEVHKKLEDIRNRVL